MTSIPIIDILTIIFVLVDDWYQVEGHKFIQGKPGKKPEFSDSEMMTLMLAQDFREWLKEWADEIFDMSRISWEQLFIKLAAIEAVDKQAQRTL